MVHSKHRLWEQAIAALLSARSIGEAARQVNVNERTLKRWLALAEFRDMYQKAKTELLKSATAKLRQSAGAAVDTLEAISKDGDAPAGARVRASSDILRLALDAEVLESLEERIRKLEETTNESERP